jgi:hypothetical protein
MVPQRSRLILLMGAFQVPLFPSNRMGPCSALLNMLSLSTNRDRYGSIRLVYAARLGDCRDCSLRSACQGLGKSPRRGRRVHAVCQPLPATEDTTTVPTEPSPLQNDQSVAPVLEPAPCRVSPATLPTEHRPASSVPTLLQSAPVVSQEVESPASTVPIVLESVPNPVITQEIE